MTRGCTYTAGYRVSAEDCADWPNSRIVVAQRTYAIYLETVLLPSRKVEYVYGLMDGLADIRIARDTASVVRS